MKKTIKPSYKLPLYKKRKLIQQNKYLDFFMKDSDWTVRSYIAEQDYKLNILINDPNDYVRMAVAAQGYGLSQLINDESIHVRNRALRYCKEHSYLQECQNILNLLSL